MRWVNMVVFPLPVGEETPMRVTPQSRAERQSWIHSSWYGRSEKAGAAESSAVAINAVGVCSDKNFVESSRDDEHDRRRNGGGVATVLRWAIAILSASTVERGLTKSSERGAPT